MALMEVENLSQLAVIDSSSRVIDLIFRNEDNDNIFFGNSVILMAGGEGRRLLPLTESIPKPMIIVQAMPMLETVLITCRDHRFRNLFISVNYRKKQIMDYLGDRSNWNIEIKYLNEGRPLRTAGSLALLRKQPVAPKIELDGDVLTQVDLLSVLRFRIAHDAVAHVAVSFHEIQIPFRVIQIDGGDDEIIGREAGDHTLYPRCSAHLHLPVAPEYSSGATVNMTRRLNSAFLNSSKVVVSPIHEYWLYTGINKSLEQANDDKR
jgi:NDP-sugar pyrophosphorylase family protein